MQIVIFSTRKNLIQRLGRVDTSITLKPFFLALAESLADKQITVREYTNIFATLLKEHVSQQVEYERVRNAFPTYSEMLFSPDSTLKQRNLTYSNYWRSLLSEIKVKNIPLYNQTTPELVEALQQEAKVVSEKLESVLGTDTEIYMLDELQQMTAKELGEILGSSHVGKTKANLLAAVVEKLENENRLLQ